MIRLHVGARFDFDHLRTSHRPGPVYEELAGLAEAILTCNTVSFCLCAPSKPSRIMTREFVLTHTQPFFLLLTFGYKLIFGTTMVKVEDMPFDLPEPPAEQVPTKPSSLDTIVDWVWGSLGKMFRWVSGAHS